MLASIQDASPVVCGATFLRRAAADDDDGPPLDVANTPVSYRRALVSVVTYLLLLTDVPRTAGSNGVIRGHSVEPTVFLPARPATQPIVRILRTGAAAFTATQGNTSVTSLPVATYKNAASGAALRGYMFNRNLWPPCLDYRAECPSDTLAIADVFAFWDTIATATAAAAAPRAFQSVDTTLKYSLRVHDERLDRIFDYLAFQFVDLTAYRSVWVSYANASIDVSALCSVNAIGRPLFCSKSWAMALDSGLSIAQDIAARKHALQAAHPTATVDLFVAESEADPARRHGGFAYVGFSAFDATTVLRVREAGATLLIDETRYAGGRIWTNSGSWTSYTQGFRSIGQAYMVLRLVMLFAGCYVATDGSLAGAVKALLQVPSQVVVYGSWFPVMCYALAHLIDAPVTYTATEQCFSSLGDLLRLPFDQLCFVLAVRMRGVWVLALFIKLFSFVLNIGVWHPNGTVGLRGHLIPLLVAAALIAIVQVPSLQGVAVRAVYVVEPSTVIALYMSEVFTDMNNRLSGVYHDALSTIAAFVVLALPVGLGVYWWRHPSRKPLFFGKTKTPFAAAKLWSYTAMTVSWGDGILDADAHRPTATMPMPRSDMSRLNSRIASRKISTTFFRSDADMSSKHVLMNVVHMSDPITYLWLSAGSLVVYEYSIAAPAFAKKTILHPFTKDDIIYHCYDIAKEELTLRATLLTKDIPWRRLVRCY
ncbi:hypothetical protein ACHHYP_13003 [Achlya hypogyna]|uniref:Transmembrane protein n=1 Tax=Achlya hypogyna TaxID=1202772 RepID=A0A1V9YG87_ACHHY|nr:hypothetical protein ACHHYP_13003 [Achlya hypogyna]